MVASAQFSGSGMWFSAELWQHKIKRLSKFQQFGIYVSLEVVLRLSKIRALIRMATYEIVMIRHGESTWNQENKFCGW